MINMPSAPVNWTVQLGDYGGRLQKKPGYAVASAASIFSNNPPGPYSSYLFMCGNSIMLHNLTQRSSLDAFRTLGWSMDQGFPDPTVWGFQKLVDLDFLGCTVVDPHYVFFLCLGSTPRAPGCHGGLNEGLVWDSHILKISSWLGEVSTPMPHAFISSNGNVPKSAERHPKVLLKGLPSVAVSPAPDDPGQPRSGRDPGEANREQRKTSDGFPDKEIKTQC